MLNGGNGGEILLDGGKGEDVIRGGDGNDYLVESSDGRRDKLYCGKGRDHYSAEDIDYVDSSCEEGQLVDTGGPSLILLAGAALFSMGLLLGRSLIRRALVCHARDVDCEGQVAKKRRVSPGPPARRFIQGSIRVTKPAPGAKK